MGVHTDVIIVGAGHNGLIAAAVLAKRGVRVTVVEERGMIGGATKTEFPFPKAPRLGASTASYLLGVMPPEILERTGTKLELIRRNPHYFLPMLDGRSLLIGTDHESMKEQFLAMFSRQDWRANAALAEEIAMIRDDLAPSWLAEPLSVQATAEKYIRPSLQEVFVKLVTGTVRIISRDLNFKARCSLRCTR